MRIFLLSALLLAPALAQQTTARYAGAVIQGDPANRALLLRLDGGGERWIAAPPHVDILRLAPGEKDVAKASKLPFERVQPGDRVVARSGSDAAGIAIASQILVLSHSELVSRQTAERAAWKARGVTGKVLSVDADRGEIVVITPARPEAKTIAIRVSARTDQRRYRPDSPRYTDAVPSTLANVQPGDQLQALLEPLSNGAAAHAEKLVSGAFRNFAGKILRIDAAGRQITVQPVDGAPQTLRVGPAATLRRLRPEDAAALASLKPAQPGEARQGAAAPQTIFESSPSVIFEDFKSGDAVLVATGGNGDRSGPLPAVAVIAGAEPLLKRSGETQKELIGSWDLSLDPGEPGGRGGN